MENSKNNMTKTSVANLPLFVCNRYKEMGVLIAFLFFSSFGIASASVLVCNNSDEDYVLIDGIKYELNHTNQTARVVLGNVGDVIIKDYIEKDGITYTVTEIGENSFAYIGDLTSVYIPNTVIAIGKEAFARCTGLSSLTIPNSVTNIGVAAFQLCSSLTSITIPNSVTSIGSSAFANCSSLTSVMLPNSLTCIGAYVFSSCTNLPSITIPTSVTSIGNFAFSGCSKLEYIVIPDNVQSIGYDAFWRCKGLDSVVIGNGVESIGTWAFCECSNMTSLTIGNGIKFIDDAAFSGCNKLQKVIINDLASWCRISFKNYVSNPLVYAQHLYIGETEIEDLEIPNTVSKINSVAFYGFSGIKTLTIPISVQSIGFNAFFYCKNLTSIKLPSRLTVIPEACFGACVNLREVIIPNSVTTIGNNAFAGCSSLSTIFIGNKVNQINSLAFSSCQSLQNIYLKGSVPTTNNAFSFSNLTATVFIQKDFIDEIKNNPEWGMFSNIKEYPTTSLNINDSVTVIDDDFFSNDTILISSVVIPSSVKIISNLAFHGMRSLRKIIIESDSVPLEFCEGDNFNGCMLDTVLIGRNMKYTYKSPFDNNKEKIIKMTIGGGYSEIRDKEFLGYKKLMDLNLSDGLKKVGNMAFYGCDGLSTLTISGSVTEIGMQAFDLCRNLKTLAFEDGTETLAFTAPENNLNDAFQNSPIENIYLGRNISFSNSSPFSIIETLKTLTIGNEVTHVANKAFIGCPNLKDVTSYAKTVPTTGEVVFTPSYLPSATLHVPYELYNQYKVAPTWKDFGNIKNFEGLYNLTYMVDGEIYKDSVVEQNSPITPEAEPTKDYYTFSGWSEVPDTMPDHDVTITGSFIPNKYKLIYQVDGVDYVVYDVAYGSAITPETDPIKEGYTFSGWSEVPDTMPGHDVTVTGSFAINSYLLTYTVDGEIVESDSIEYNTVLTPIEEPTKEGYTFSGWSDIPEMMPAHDVTVTGSFSVNSYTLTYMVDDKVYKETMYEYGATIIPEPQPEGDYATFEWIDLPQTMPAHDVVVHASYTTGIIEVLMATQRNLRIYSPNGKKLNKLQKGLNILVLDNGTVKKVVVK